MSPPARCRASTPREGAQGLIRRLIAGRPKGSLAGPFCFVRRTDTCRADVTQIATHRCVRRDDTMRHADSRGIKRFATDRQGACRPRQRNRMRQLGRVAGNRRNTFFVADDRQMTNSALTSQRLGLRPSRGLAGNAFSGLATSNAVKRPDVAEISRLRCQCRACLRWPRWLKQHGTETVGESRLRGRRRSCPATG